MPPNARARARPLRARLPHFIDAAAIRRGEKMSRVGGRVRASAF